MHMHTVHKGQRIFGQVKNIIKFNKFKTQRFLRQFKYKEILMKGLERVGSVPDEWGNPDSYSASSFPHCINRQAFHSRKRGKSGHKRCWSPRDLRR